MTDASPFSTRSYLTIFLLSLVWWLFAASGDQGRFTAFIGPSLLGLAGGAVVGFLFSSYGEEQASIGKIRDWILGGLTGITIAEVMERGNMVKAGIQHFVPRGEPDGFGTIVSMMFVYATLGFFVMFFNRELIWNPMLAQGRNRRRQLEQLSPTVGQKLAQVEAVRLITHESNRADEPPPPQMSSSPVKAFIKAAEEAQEAGESLDLAQISRLANLYYFRQEYGKAIPHLRRALELNPQDSDLTSKLARALAEVGQRDEAVKLLESLLTSPSAPFSAFRSLGYYLLWYKDRLEEAADYSQKYLVVAPGDSGARLNLACAYGQLYGQGKEEYGERALDALAQVVNQTPVWKHLARELAKDPDGDFWELRDDARFRAIVSPDEDSSAKH